MCFYRIATNNTLTAQAYARALERAAAGSTDIQRVRAISKSFATVNIGPLILLESTTSSGPTNSGLCSFQRKWF